MSNAIHLTSRPDAEFTLWTATPADAEVIGGFLAGIILDHDEQPLPLATLIDVANQIIALPHARFLLCGVLQADGAPTPVGMVQITERISTWWARPFFYLDDYYVTPEWRSRGVGRRLFAEVKRQAAAINCVRIDLDVYAGNDRAYQFYLREGFIDSGESLMRFNLG